MDSCVVAQSGVLIVV